MYLNNYPLRFKYIDMVRSLKKEKDKVHEGSVLAQWIFYPNYTILGHVKEILKLDPEPEPHMTILTSGQT